MQSITEKLGAPPVLPYAKIPPSMREMTLNITVSTPMAGGGIEAGEVDVKRPVRVPSVKGHLRYWWRMMNRNSPDEDTRESEIFGSTDKPGKVFLSVGQPEALYIRYSNNNFGFDKFSSENYAPFSLKQNGNDIARENFSFTLSIRYPENYHDDVRLALSAWIYFGGIGERTRRGCESLSCKENPSSLGEILRAASHITFWRKKPGGSDPVSAWSEAVKNYRDYRQSKDGGKFGRSQWPEADSIRQITGKEYKSFVLSFPSLIHSCGLVQAIAFAKKETKGKDSRIKSGYIDDLQKVFDTIDNAGDLPERSREAPVMEYMRITRHAISAASWIKRYCQASENEGANNIAGLP